ncbi:hypothetical protein HYX10_02600 [Candidatus Woesearchaeota archaeon]|nr:hypothetical protein [Candidatus Woesearchaeota archaeon]
MLQQIIDEIRNRLQKAEGSEPVFSNRRYKPVKFSENNYKDIGKGRGQMLTFVDGGNAELVSAPGLSLQLMRNAAVVMKNNKLVTSRKREFYVLAASNEKGAAARIFGSGIEEVHGKDVASLCESIRKSSEIRFATEMLNEGTIVLDGTLEAENEMEKLHLDELFSIAAAKHITVAALAKTTTLVTEKGSSYAAMINAKRSNGAWYYYPVAEIATDFHRAEMLFVKLHEKSSHVFRTEVYNNQKEQIAEAAAELKENARELTFPGYPYGLILADKLARISGKEADYMKAKLFAAAGNKWSELRKSLAAVNAHEILDSM